MHQKGEFLYYESSDFQAVDLPYKGRQLSMLVVLPKKVDGYNQITKRFFEDETVILSLPRFKLETEINLKPVLCELGAGLAFGNEPDFTGICDEPLKIAEVIHKAFVEVNEEGTEAAAATGVLLGYKSVPPPSRVFKADHPFLFFIRDRNTNTVLFSGRVVNPQ